MKIVFALPGNSFHCLFFNSWMNLYHEVIKSGIIPMISQEGGSHVGLVRKLCLGGNIKLGPDQMPFKGMDFDYIMWIDSDVVFGYEHFKRLLDAAEEGRDIVSGLVPFINGEHYAVAEDYSEEEYIKLDYGFKWMPKALLPERQKEGIIPIDIFGMAFVLMSRNVFKKIKYPWFGDGVLTLSNGNKLLMTDDIGFSFKCKEAGIQAYADLNCVVGHVKEVLW